MGATKGTPLAILVALSLLLAACSPATPPPPSSAKPPAAAPTAAPAKPPAAPAATPKPAAEQPRSGGILLTNVNTNPPNFDIHQGTTLSVVSSFGPAYNGLVKYDPFKVGEIVGDLAQRWEVTDGGKVYTFHLNKGVKFHDGSQLTAEDVKFSIDRIRKPPPGTMSQRKNALSSIKDIDVVDKDTVKVALQFPHSAFLGMLATGWEVVMPKAVVEAKKDMKRDVVGTGPFKFISHDSGVGTELKKNPDYFVKGRPYLDGMRVYVITDPTTKFAALRTKRLHMTNQTNGLTATQAELIAKEKLGINVAKSEGLSNWQVHMRFDVAPWNDIRVRRAVNLAIDRQEAIRVVSEGSGDIGAALPGNNKMAIPTAEVGKMPGFRQPKDADIAEAKRLLADAGFARGIDADMLFRSGGTWEKGAVFYKDQLAKIGINVKLEGMDAGTYVTRLYEGRFVLANYKDASFGYEPEFIMGEAYVTGGGKNYSKYTDKEFERMFEEQRQSADTAKRKEILLKMQQRILETIPFVLSHWETYLMGLWPEVRNYLTLTDSYANNKWQDVWLTR